jgi:glycosyltransferase involved in cell wall biosynthesis
MSPWDGLPSGLRILYVGRLQDIKGPHLLLEAMRGPLAGRRDLAVAFVAAPGELDYGARFAGEVAQEPRARLLLGSNVVPLAAMAAADVVVVPSMCLETGPFTVLEARWVGTPVVGSALGGIAEQLSGVPTGRTFAAGDTDALARSLLEFGNHRVQAQENLPEVRRALRTRFDLALDALTSRLSLAGP